MPTSLEIVKRFYPNVEHVKNAPKTVTVEVTKGDVQKGSVKNHKECVMANACKRTFKADGAVVSLGTVYLVKGDEATRYKVPQNLAREIVAFDRGGSFSTGEYCLSKPERIAPRGSGTRHPGNPRQGNRPPHNITSGVRTSLSQMGR